MARKVTVEVEVPGGMEISSEEIAMIQSAAKRTLLYILLEKKQRKEPTQQELEELARQAKQNIYKRIMEAKD